MHETRNMNTQHRGRWQTTIRSLVFAALGCASALSQAQQAPSQARGEMLYNTHCISCHSTQMHWRNDRLAFDWDSLKAQVRNWQGRAGLQWGDADITEVARHLNDTIYRHPQTSDRVSQATPPAAR
jgi:mono/diheme cytochrome c family protein